MGKSKVLHYAGYDPPTEGDNCGYWTETACGHWYDNSTHHEDQVSCKNCLRKMGRSTTTLSVDEKGGEGNG